jgi:hypothetical protein
VSDAARVQALSDEGVEARPPATAEQLRGWVAFALENLNDVDRNVGTVCDPAELALILDDLHHLRADVKVACDSVERLLAHAMPDKTMDVEGLGRIEKKGRWKRTGWDHEALLVAVLDSRGVDANGEPMDDETPAEKMASVYGLKGYNASITALAARRIDPGEFCREEFDGYQVRLP